jgi:hypothetical protein
MATVETVLASKSGPALMSSQAGQAVVQRGTYNVLAAQAEDATLSIRVVKIPAQHRITKVVLSASAMGTSLTLDVGVEDTVGATSDPNLFTATPITTGAAGGIVDVTNKAGLDLAAADNNRYLTVDVVVVAGTGADGTIDVLLECIPELGTQFAGNAS